jgi:aspartyl-tRNA(Asn)/glutamyl-tRNA(Gln) amidotransferase subunit C
MITTADIEKLASLARIKISEEGKESMTKDIESILEYVGQVKNIKQDSVSESKNVPLVHNVMREDVVTNVSGAHTEDLLSAAPHREGNYLKVKKILG